MGKKIKELKVLNNEGLQKRLQELKKELMKNYAQVATGTIPKSPGEIKRSRKTIARILTLQNNRRTEKKA